MGRWPRVWRPGEGVHFLSRFIDRGYCLIDDADRRAYLDNIGDAQERWDWRWLSYALMSSHVHHGTLAGRQAPERFFRSVHTRVASRYRKRYGTVGRIFADRPKSFDVPRSRLARMVAYHHRNPVAAGVVATPKESTWTSHRAYLRLSSAPPWLDVEWALGILGFDDTAAGRRRFDEFVTEVDLSDFDADCREGADDLVADLVRAQVAPTLSEPDWMRLIACAAEVMSITLPEAVRSRAHRAARARRLVASIARDDLGQTHTAIAERLGRAVSSIHSLLCRTPSDGTVAFEAQRSAVLSRYASGSSQSSAIENNHEGRRKAKNA